MVALQHIMIVIIIIATTTTTRTAAATATTTTTTTKTTTIIIIIMIIIIALKGANRDFYNLLTAPQTVSNTYAQEAREESCENHVQHIERLSRATCSVPLGTKGQLSY